MKSLIVTKNTPHIVTLKLNNPEQRNALSESIIDELEEKLKELERDKDVRVVILTGEGKAFCAGGDLKSMETKSGMFAGGPNELRENYAAYIQRIPNAVEKFSKPIIAMINGAAIGAGCDLACMCDIRIASNNALFGETFTKLGLVPGDGGTYFLQRVIGYAKAMELFLSAEVINATKAKELGLINLMVDESVLEIETLKFAEKIAANAPIAVSLTKKAMKHSYHSSLLESLDLLAAYQGISQRSNDHFKALESFKDKKTPKFERD